MFMKKMMKAHPGNICKKAILNEIITRTKGLASECKELGEEIGIRDMRFCEVTNGEINRAIRTKSWNSRRAEMAESSKVGDRASDDPKENSYMTYMTLNDCRLWMRVKARMMKAMKMNHKSSHRGDLSCSFCKGPLEESQEHLEEECTGCDFERRTLKMHTLRGRQIFLRRMQAKIEEKRKKKNCCCHWGWARHRGEPCGGTVG